MNHDLDDLDHATKYIRKGGHSDVGCIPNDIMGMCWFSEMPLSVVDALLNEPLLLIKAEEVNCDKEFLPGV